MVSGHKADAREDDAPSKPRREEKSPKGQAVSPATAPFPHHQRNTVAAWC